MLVVSQEGPLGSVYIVNVNGPGSDVGGMAGLWFCSVPSSPRGSPADAKLFCLFFFLSQNGKGTHLRLPFMFLGWWPLSLSYYYSVMNQNPTKSRNRFHQFVYSGRLAT
jgi:hypothetical protein